MSSEQFEEELREVTIVVRSLITSTKPPVSLSNIERDYLNVEMRPIPFRRLGFRNTLELLQETNAFDFQKYGNDVSSSKSTDTQKTATTARALALFLSLPLSLSGKLFGSFSLLCFWQPLLLTQLVAHSVWFVASARTAVLFVRVCACCVCVCACYTRGLACHKGATCQSASLDCRRSTKSVNNPYVVY